MTEDNVLDFKNVIEPVAAKVITTARDLADLHSAEISDQNEINDLLMRVQSLADKMGTEIPISQPLEIKEIEQLNITLDSLLNAPSINQKYPKFPQLTSVDIIVSSVAGLVAIAIDVLLVGTPEVVKIYGGGERFDGSVLTAAIRKLSDGPIGAFGEKLSKICKVPYDVSVIKDGMYPQVTCIVNKRRSTH